MQPGQPELIEYVSRRHGTQALITNFEVPIGKIIARTVQDARTKADFVAHVQQTDATDPEWQWQFVADK